MLQRLLKLSDRWLYSMGVLVVGGLIAGALYLQYGLREDPCPLCMMQRLVFIVIGFFFLLATIHNAGRIGRRIYSGLIVFVSLIGVGVASRHIWLQHLPKDQVPACGPGLEYMLQNFPMGEVWQELMHGSGECAEKGWSMFGLGLPEWALLWFVLLGAWAVLIAAKRS